MLSKFFKKNNTDSIFYKIQPINNNNVVLKIPKKIILKPLSLPIYNEIENVILPMVASNNNIENSNILFTNHITLNEINNSMKQNIMLETLPLPMIQNFIIPQTAFNRDTTYFNSMNSIPDPLILNTIQCQNLNCETATITNTNIINLTSENITTINANINNIEIGSGEIILNNSEGSHILKAELGSLFYDNIELVKSSDIQDIQSWSEYNALTNVNLENNSLLNVQSIQSSTIGSWNDEGITVNSLSTETIKILNETNLINLTSDLNNNLLVNQNALAFQSALNEWSAIDASSELNMLNFPIKLNNGSLTTTSDGLNLLFNGQTISTGSSGDVSTWSNYPSISNIDISNNLNITNGLININNDDELSSSIITNSNIQCRELQSSGRILCSSIVQEYGMSSNNFLANGLTIGETSPIYTGSLTVNGGVVFDGGENHGCSISCRPILGINSTRIDVLPIGTVDILAVAAITINTAAAANIASGAVLSLSAGSYVEINSGELQIINTTSGQSLMSVNQIQPNNHNGGNNVLTITGNGTGIINDFESISSSNITVDNINNKPYQPLKNVIYLEPSFTTSIYPSVIGNAVMSVFQITPSFNSINNFIHFSLSGIYQNITSSSTTVISYQLHYLENGNFIPIGQKVYSTIYNGDIQSFEININGFIAQLQNGVVKPFMILLDSNFNTINFIDTSIKATGYINEI